MYRWERWDTMELKLGNDIGAGETGEGAAAGETPEATTGGEEIPNVTSVRV